MPKSPRPKPVGRPTFDVTPEQVRDGARRSLSVAEIAAILGCSERTLHRRMEQKVFREAFDQGRNLSKHDIKSMIWAAALNGSVKALTLLAYNELGWSDRVSSTVEQNTNFVVEIPGPLNPEEWTQVYGGTKPAIDVTPAKIAEKP